MEIAGKMMESVGKMIAREKTPRLERRGLVLRARESGQTILFVVLGLSIFLLAAAAFAVDLSNFWFHRQVAQDAADAACTAGAMDMLEMAQGSSAPKPNFVAGTAFNCSTTTPNTNVATAPVPCWYAATNGYAAKGLAAGKPSDEVSVTFPASVPGATPPTAAEKGSLAPFMQVMVEENLQTFFMGLVASGTKTMDVRAVATCGVIAVPSEVPILVLDPRNEQSISLKGNAEISISGGGTQGIQVNSSSTSAVGANGNTLIDLSKGGPNRNGSSLGVTGAEGVQGNFASGTPAANYWDMAAARKPDPLAGLPVPSRPGNTPPATGTKVLMGVNGCPDTSCQEYVAGYYPSDITVKNGSAIFDPGLYYLDGALNAGPNSCLRPSTTLGDGTGGTIFYFHGTGTLSVGANSGSCTGTVPVSALQCTGGSALPPGLTPIGGNLLVAPCTGTYGDQLGGTETGGEQRGILFFQNRAVQANPSWGGGGSSAAAGTMYFHQCVTSGADTGFNCSAMNAYQDTFSMGGNACSENYVVGSVITDQISMSGTPCLNMYLNTNPSNNVLKASLLK